MTKRALLLMAVASVAMIFKRVQLDRVVAVGGDLRSVSRCVRACSRRRSVR